MNNIAKENQEVFKRLGSPELINNSILYKCVGCGKNNVSTGNIKYFHNDVTRVKCYECQDYPYQFKHKKV